MNRLPLLLICLVAALVVAGVETSQAASFEDWPCTPQGELMVCPEGVVGEPYSLTFLARRAEGCGSGSAYIRLASGYYSPGLQISSSKNTQGEPMGEGTFIRGTPIQPGSYRFWLVAEDPNLPGCNAAPQARKFHIVIRETRDSPPPKPRPNADPENSGLLIAPTVAFAGEVGLRYTMPLVVREGEMIIPPPFSYSRWSLRDGQLPLGLTILGETGDGLITGVPKSPGTYSFTVEAMTPFLYWPAPDVLERFKISRSYTIKVYPQLLLGKQKLPLGQVGSVYRAKLKAVGGAPARNWRVVRGSLPRGLCLERRTGLLIGKPAKAGSYRLTVEVKDSLGGKARRFLLLNVHAR